jgi:uncharacterized protein (TIGR01777 family)
VEELMIMDIREPVAGTAALPATLWVTGASGFVGSALLSSLPAEGRRGVPLGRDLALPEPPDEPFAVVHLAGENIASGRWTRRKKDLIRGSRVEGTSRLVNALLSLKRRPSVLVCASAIGVYGNRRDEVLTESSARGAGFLADVCSDWEASAAPASEAGIRVVRLRFGMILDPRGGALARMLPPFKAGLGGRLGPGDQFMSWITREDAIGAIRHVLATPSVRGPVNAVSPEPLTNREFTSELGRALGRPTVFPMPSFAAKLLFGQMAEELLLSSQRVYPRVLEESGYRFRHRRIADAFQALLGKPVTS